LLFDFSRTFDPLK